MRCADWRNAADADVVAVTVVVGEIRTGWACNPR